MSWKVPPSKCYGCDAVLDMATESTKGTYNPKPGAVSICIECLSLSIFDGDLRLRKPSKWKAEELAKDKSLQERIKFIRKFKEEHPMPK